MAHTPNAATLLRQAIEEIRVLRATKAVKAEDEPIAVIGIGNRFPGGVNTPENFWIHLRAGHDLTGSRSGKRGRYLDALEEFDPTFFGIAPLEAPLIDPQHRLLLEVSWEALEDALIPAPFVRQVPVGFFAGISHDDYAQQTLRSGHAAGVAGPAALGCARSMGPARVAYLLGLTGPVMQIDTSCSSSLVAVHLACQSIRGGECEMAFAGGVNLTLSEDLNDALEHLGALAPDGRCKTFDADADGYVRGEGCGLVLLRRLSAALASGDRIRAVIAGSAVNHDGQSNGLTAPNGSAQAALITKALRVAKLRAEDIHYIEAHGTGTRLGDPVELEALAHALGDQRKSDLYVGSVKSNIGHLESAAGIAGLIKTVLMVEHGEIPPSLHVQRLNPHFDWSRHSFRVPAKTLVWPEEGKQRAAGVSAFGMSGTNAHVIVTSASRVEREPERQDARPYLLCVSARSEWAALTLKAEYAEQLAGGIGNLADYSYSTRAGRSAWPFRIAVTGSDRQELTHALDTAIPRECRLDGRVAFRLHGCGTGDLDGPLCNMPEIRGTLEQCRTQPLYAVQCALGDLWRSWGIEPVAIAADAASQPAAKYLRREISLEQGLIEAAVNSSPMPSDCSDIHADIVLEIGWPRAAVLQGAVPSLMLGRTAAESLMAAVAEVWRVGAAIDWASFDAGYGRRRVPLPLYPFQKKRCWVDLRVQADASRNSGPSAMLHATEDETPSESLRDRLTGLSPAVQRRELMDHVSAVVAEKLGYPIAEVPSSTEGFFQMGMSSLAAAEVAETLCGSTEYPLSPTDLFVYSNVEELAEFLMASIFPAPRDNSPEQHAPKDLRGTAISDQQSGLSDEIREVERLLRARGA